MGVKTTNATERGMTISTGVTVVQHGSIPQSIRRSGRHQRKTKLKFPRSMARILGSVHHECGCVRASLLETPTACIDAFSEGGGISGDVVWKRDTGHDQQEAWFNRFLDRIPAPVQSHEVPTRYGPVMSCSQGRPTGNPSSACTPCGPALPTSCPSLVRCSTDSGSSPRTYRASPSGDHKSGCRWTTIPTAGGFSMCSTA